MATSDTSYYNNSAQSAFTSAAANCQMRTVPATIVIPKLPQATLTRSQQAYHTEHDTTPSATGKRCNLEVFPYQFQDSKIPGYLTTNTGDCPPSTSKSTAARPSSRSENLKRRSSLRDAARSIRTSRVVKRLRRHTRDDFDMEDEDDAGVSASESDHSCDPLCSHATNPAQCDQSAERRDSVSSLMNGLQSSLTIGTYGRGRGTSLASQTSSGFVDSSDSASTRTSLTTLSSVSKRSHSMGGDDVEGDDEEDSDRVGKRPCSISALETEQPQLFACPYAKHDAKRYSSANLEELNYRGCSQSYLTDLARVKQHLYRVHIRPQHHCSNCFEVFKNQAQGVKHAAAQSCLPRPCPFTEKMTPEQLATIKKKNRGTDPYLGWYEIYKTLFPGSSLPMSPYAAFTATVDTLESFVELITRELPLRLQHRLGLNDAVHSAIQASLPDILRDIRREFHITTPQKQETPTRDTVEPAMPEFEEQGSALTPNFHHMVTNEAPENDPMRMLRPASLNHSVPNIFVYPPHQTVQVLSNQLSSQVPIYDQCMQPDMSAFYAQQPPLLYAMQNNNFMSSMNSGPPTAIWQPDGSENVGGYFDQRPQSHETSAAYSLQVQSEGTWIPEMTTTRMNRSVHNQGASNVMEDLFQGGFRNGHN